MTRRLKIDSELVSAYTNRGTAKRELGKYHEAILDYDKAIELDPQLAQAYYNRGIVKERIRQTS